MELITPVGRMVQGHPMVLHPVTDKHGVQKINKNNQPQEQVFVALAIPKGHETDWKQHPFLAQVYNAGVTEWPRGEHGAPTFAWKITDGDSRTPNKKGKIPAEREGFPGHWVLSASNGFAPDCYADKNYTTQVMRPERFKTGDYIRLVIDVKGNGSSESPGIYINIKGCELIQAGAEIATSSFDATSTFGATDAQLPVGAVVDPNMAGAAPPSAPVMETATPPPPPTPAMEAAAPPPPPAMEAAAPPPPPAHDFLLVNGVKYTSDSLRASGYSEQQIAALPKA